MAIVFSYFAGSTSPQVLESRLRRSLLKGLSRKLDIADMSCLHVVTNKPQPLRVVLMVESLISCPKCKREMRLIGIEAESDVCDLFTFECIRCRGLEVRGVLMDETSHKPDLKIV